MAPSRSAKVPAELLNGYQGIVMSDGYSAYQSLARASPTLVLVFCWAHVRRKFLEALPAYPQAQTAPDLIGALYQVERKLPAQE